MCKLFHFSASSLICSVRAWQLVLPWWGVSLAHFAPLLQFPLAPSQTKDRSQMHLMYSKAMAPAPHPQRLADLETSGHKQSAALVENWCSPQKVLRKHVSLDRASCSAWEGERLAQMTWRRKASQSWSTVFVLWPGR